MNNNWEKLNSIIPRKNVEEYTKIEIINLICVLAGGLQENGEPHEFVKKRLDKVFEIYNDIENTYVLILGGGTYHKPPVLNDENFAIHESTSCALYLYNKGINPNYIFREWSSYDTIANGFFAFTNYINYLNLKQIILVTSDFHLSRSKVIFDYFNKLFNKNIKIIYIGTKSDLDEATFQIRYEREKESRKVFLNSIVNKIKNPVDFIKWFYTTHKAYKSIIKYKTNNKINKTY